MKTAWGGSKVPSSLSLHVRNDYTVEEAIRKFAEEQKVDLIAMGTHARKGLKHFLTVVFQKMLSVTSLVRFGLIKLKNDDQIYLLKLTMVGIER